jgi:hypothetical protein
MFIHRVILINVALLSLYVSVASARSSATRQKPVDVSDWSTLQPILDSFEKECSYIREDYCEELREIVRRVKLTVAAPKRKQKTKTSKRQTPTAKQATTRTKNTIQQPLSTSGQNKRVKTAFQSKNNRRGK